MGIDLFGLYDVDARRSNRRQARPQRYRRRGMMSLDKSSPANHHRDGRWIQ